jgi:hypothetical protein
MRKVLITFSGAQYHDTTKKTVEDAPKFGATEVLVYDDWWLFNKCPGHIADTRHLIDHPRNRGVNWFCFKPFVILDALNRVGPEDVVFYIDGDTFPIADINVVFDITARDGIMLFMANGWAHQRVWCKRACFVLMNQDKPEYHEAHCGVARFMGFTHRHRDFLKSWLGFCMMQECTTFDINPNFGPELPGFKEHRCEQAIMTNLAHKHGIKLHREADEWGDTVDPQGYPDSLLDRDLYDRLFTQTWGDNYAPGVVRGDKSAGSIFRNV